MKGVYLLHFSQPYRHAKHYIGFAEDIDRRIAAHHKGASARLIQVIHAAGIGFVCAQMWINADRNFERKLKKRGGAARTCPICKAMKKNEPCLF